MYAMCGIADEAGAPLEAQINAHKELGWGWIEPRNVDGRNLHDLDDAAFDTACRQLDRAGLRVACFASTLANWASPVTRPLDEDQALLRRALARMRRLDCRFLRVMSWQSGGLDGAAWRDQAVARMKSLAAMAWDEGAVLALENCDGWASQSPAHFTEFLERVDSPALRACYDTGNPASHGFDDPWPWWEAAKPRLCHIHVKAHTGGPDGRHVWPGEGVSRAGDTLADAFASGYRGIVSIEPHLKAIIHAGQAIDDPKAAWQTYIEYGRRAETLAAEAWKRGCAPKERPTL